MYVRCGFLPVARRFQYISERVECSLQEFLLVPLNLMVTEMKEYKDTPYSQLQSEKSFE